MDDLDANGPQAGPGNRAGAAGSSREQEPEGENVPLGDILGMLMGRVMSLRAATQVNQELLIQLLAEKKGVDVESLTEDVNKQEEAYKEALWEEWNRQTPEPGRSGSGGPGGSGGPSPDRGGAS